MALRLKYAAHDLYLQSALTDGVTGDPKNSQGTQIKLNMGDGTFSIVELGYTPTNEDKSISKTALGMWNYTTRAIDLVTGKPRPDRDFHALAERTLMVEKGQSDQGLAGFVRLGTANKDVYQSDWSVSTGLHYL